MVGIISCGSYIPRYRIKIDEIAKTWQKDSRDVETSLGVVEKSVAAIDEDAVTLAIEAGMRSLQVGNIEPEKIAALLVGSESHPYAVNPTSTIVGDFLNIGNNYLAVDLQFACKAGTTALQMVAGLILADKIKNGMAIGSDVAQSKPHDVLEYTSAAGAAAIVLGKTHLIAQIIDFTSYSSDTPDFWRRDGIRYPSHGGRFTGEPAYFHHVINAGKRLFDKTKVEPKEIDYCVFHSPNGKFPVLAAKRLGFTAEQLLPSLLVDRIGNPYSASSMISLIAVLEQARPGQKIFLVSYGSGAGSDAFLLQTTEKILNFQAKVIEQKNTIKQMMQDKTYISYTQYLKQTHRI